MKKLPLNYSNILAAVISKILNPDNS